MERWWSRPEAKGTGIVISLGALTAGVILLLGRTAVASYASIAATVLAFAGTLSRLAVGQSRSRRTVDGQPTMAHHGPAAVPGTGGASWRVPAWLSRRTHIERVSAAGCLLAALAVAGFAVFGAGLGHRLSQSGRARPAPSVTAPTGAGSPPASTWTARTGGDIEASPWADGGMVYAASDDHYLYAVNAATGRVLWRTDVGSERDSGPVAAYGNVYIGSWRDHRVYAVDAATGKIRWRFTTGSSIDSTPAVADGYVYIGSDDTRLYKLDAMTGHPIWARHLDGEIDIRPAVDGGKVFAGSYGGEVYAVSAASGAILWHATVGGHIVGSSPVVRDNRVYIGGDGDGTVYALDERTGAVRWRFRTHGSVDSTPAVADGVVYIGSEDRSLYAISAATGAEMWYYPTGGYVDSDPVVAHGKVYVGSDDDMIYAIDARTSQLAWPHLTGGHVESGPAVPAAGNTVYVGSDDTRLYALNAKTGA